MSIFFSTSKSASSDFVEIECEFITVKQLKGLIARKLSLLEGELRVSSALTGIEYADNEYIKKGANVGVERVGKAALEESVTALHQIVSNEQLSVMMGDCRFYIFKSSNEENVQKAKDCSVWATTFTNQVRLP